jgi:ferredoxin-like protein FixX
MVNVPALKGIHYALESGRLAAEAAYDALQKGEAVGRRGALQGYDDSLRDSYIWKDLKRVRNVRPAFSRGFWLGSALAGGAITSFGKLPPKDEMLERDAEQELISTDRAGRRTRAGREADLRQALVGLRVGEQDARRPAEPHPDRDARPARRGRDVGALCPAQVYEVGQEDAGKVDVQVTPSNCVQCGAITAKGGRLTPLRAAPGPSTSGRDRSARSPVDRLAPHVQSIGNRNESRLRLRPPLRLRLQDSSRRGWTAVNQPSDVRRSGHVLRSSYVGIRKRGDHVTMTRRRFAVLLSAVLALNTFFWLAQGGFALPRAMIDRFFGPRMIRAEVIVQAPRRR